MNSTLVTLAGAEVHFGRTQALHDVCLEVRQGERLALVGANGSGKTTLLRLLHGTLAPSRGTRQGRTGLRVALVHQRPFLLDLPVRWNVLVGLWLAGVSRSERGPRADTALQRVGLSRLGARPARALSGGQQQRLALAQAWALAPELLFLDEPTASLDPSAKREVEVLIERIAASGTTVVMSTHNLGQVKRLADRVAFLDGGRLLAVRTTDDFFEGRGLPAEAQQFLKGELPWIT